MSEPDSSGGLLQIGHMMNQVLSSHFNSEPKPASPTRINRLSVPNTVSLVVCRDMTDKVMCCACDVGAFFIGNLAMGLALVIKDLREGLSSQPHRLWIAF
ncbi:hypothetical protein VNO77_24657 [Canavalia gladiata]|uniref:Uncharacterized protein n=1 Tax=Canavalia gladiata TaxID=3824 RepID=A0AAN9LA20_CANGL